MSKFFINRPIFAIVIAIVITLVGLISMMNLPIARYPQISPPTVRVNTAYTGATAQVVNDTVASVIETQIVGVQDMDYMTSSSSSNGSYSLTVQFNQGTDADMDTVNHKTVYKQHLLNYLQRYKQLVLQLLNLLVIWLWYFP